jgi:hypothetical protein
MDGKGNARTLTNENAIAWAARLRNKTLPLSAEERKLLDGPQHINHEGYYSSLALVGCAPAGKVLLKLLASPDAAVRAAAATTFIHGIFSEMAVAALGEID